ISGKARIELGNVGAAGASGKGRASEAVGLEQQSNYPWDGDVRLKVTVDRPMEFRLVLRIPGWARGEAIPGGLYAFERADAGKAMIKVNGQVVDVTMEKGYAVIGRRWKKGDSVELVLPMKVQMVEACDSVKGDAGKMAIQRGPIVYCGEWVDNDGRTSNLIPGLAETAVAKFEPALLNGITTLRLKGRRVVVSPDGLDVSTRVAPVVLIPYYSWANRGKGEMTIWFPERVRAVELVSKK